MDCGRHGDDFEREGRIIMYISLIITFALLVVIIVTAIQNGVPLDFKFFTWKFQISITALIFYSSLIGGAILGILTLPKLASKSFHERGMNREIRKLKERILTLEKKDAGGSRID
jgi:uncharacterized integral membrane protein